MIESHYICAFTTHKLGWQAAACGRFVRPFEHSSEPTCPKCRTYLQAEPQTVEEAFGDGKDDRPDPIKPDADPVAEYEANYRDYIRRRVLRRDNDSS